MNEFKICAHRGLISQDYPENTLLAFQKSIEIGVDMIEIDVRFSKDKKIVISHDEDLLRCSGKPGVVADLSYDEIIKYELPKNQRVPLLSELLDLLKPTSVILNIEVKADGLEPALLEMVKSYNMEHQIVYSSFKPKVLMELKKLDPNTVRCMLSGHFPTKKLKIYMKTAEEVGSTYMNMEYQTCNEETVPIVHKAGYKIMAWTVDSQIYWEYLVDEVGVEVIITNLSEQLIQWKNSRTF